MLLLMLGIAMQLGASGTGDTGTPTSIGQIERAAGLCGTTVVVQRFPREMEDKMKASGVFANPTVEIAPNATKKQRACVARRVPIFRLMARWNDAHHKR
jgi:hypothetical protein